MLIEFPIWGLILIAILGGIGTLGGMFYFVRSAVLLVKIHTEILKLAPIVPVMLALDAQFSTDGGSSALDMIKRLEADGLLRKDEAARLLHMIENLRAEQTRLALKEQLQPATTQTIMIGAQAGQVAAGADIGQKKDG